MNIALLKTLALFIILVGLAHFNITNAQASARTYDCDWRTVGRVDRCIPINDGACEDPGCEVPARLSSACSGIREMDECRGTTGNSCVCTDNPLGQGSCSTEELDTAIGCIPISGGDAFIIFVLRWAIGIAGGIALLLIAYSGVLIMTAGGDPQKVQAGQELLTAAIAGFLFLLFSTLILEFVGVRILGIPGL